MVGTELHEIPGIGDKTVQKLMAHFGSPKKVRNALASEIAEVTNLGTAKKILDYYRSKEVIEGELTGSVFLRGAGRSKVHNHSAFGFIVVDTSRS